MEKIDEYAIFYNKMLEKEIRDSANEEQLDSLNLFDNYLIKKYKLFIRNKDGYQDYIKKSHDVFLIHFIADIQLIIFNRYLKSIGNTNLSNKELLNKIYKVNNEKKNLFIPTDNLNEADIEKIYYDIGMIKKLLERDLFFYRDADKLKESIELIISGDYKGITNLKKVFDNFNLKIELDKNGLEEYIAIKLPYYLNLQPLEERILDEVENDYCQKR